jgi:hypothetical protein
MESHETILWIEMLIILYVLLVLSMSAVVLGWNMLKTVLTLLRWVLLWVTGAKDLIELAKRFDRWTVETRERRSHVARPLHWEACSKSFAGGCGKCLSIRYGPGKVNLFTRRRGASVAVAAISREYARNLRGVSFRRAIKLSGKW